MDINTFWWPYLILSCVPSESVSIDQCLCVGRCVNRINRIYVIDINFLINPNLYYWFYLPYLSYRSFRCYRFYLIYVIFIMYLISSIYLIYHIYFIQLLYLIYLSCAGGRLPVSSYGRNLVVSLHSRVPMDCSYAGGFLKGPMPMDSSMPLYPATRKNLSPFSNIVKSPTKFTGKLIIPWVFCYTKRNGCFFNIKK